MGDLSLEERARLLEEKANSQSTVNGIGLSLDLLTLMAIDLNNDPILKELFGTPVIKKLAVFSNGKDMSITTTAEGLDPDKKRIFFQQLAKVYEKRLIGVN